VNRTCANCKNWQGTDTLFMALCEKHNQRTRFDYSCGDFELKPALNKNNAGLWNGEDERLKSQEYDYDGDTYTFIGTHTTNPEIRRFSDILTRLIQPNQNAENELNKLDINTFTGIRATNSTVSIQTPNGWTKVINVIEWEME